MQKCRQGDGVGTNGSTEKLTMQGGSPQVDWHVWHEVASMLQIELEGSGCHGDGVRDVHVQYGAGLGWVTEMLQLWPVLLSARRRTGR
jgi:hypothetical protein